MITSISVQGQINPEHAELWRSLGDVTFTSSYERIAQVLEALAPGAVALLDPLYELESEEDDDDTGEAPPGFNLSGLGLSDDRLQMLFTIECWYEDEFVALLRQLLLALPLHAWRLGGGDDPLAEDFWQSPPLAEAPSLPPANTAKKSKESKKSKEGKEGKAKSRAKSAPQLPLSLQQQLAALCADPKWQARRATIWQTQVYSDISRYYGGKALGVLEHFFMTGELTEKVRDLGLLTVLPYFPLQTPEALCYWTERFGFHGVFIYEHLVNLHRVPGLDVSVAQGLFDWFWLKQPCPPFYLPVSLAGESEPRPFAIDLFGHFKTVLMELRRVFDDYQPVPLSFFSQANYAKAIFALLLALPHDYFSLELVQKSKVKSPYQEEQKYIQHWLWPLLWLVSHGPVTHGVAESELKRRAPILSALAEVIQNPSCSEPLTQIYQRLQDGRQPLLQYVRLSFGLPQERYEQWKAWLFPTANGYVAEMDYVQPIEEWLSTYGDVPGNGMVAQVARLLQHHAPSLLPRWQKMVAQYPVLSQSTAPRWVWHIDEKRMALTIATTVMPEALLRDLYMLFGELSLPDLQGWLTPSSSYDEDTWKY